VAPYLGGIPRSGIRDFFDIVAARRDVISLGIGEPDFVTPWRIRESAIFALDRGSTSYTANRGLEGLRREIARWMLESRGLSYDPRAEILVTVGVSEALDLAVRAVTQPGDEVLYHEPCYVAYAPVVAFAHGRPVAVPTGRDNGFRLTRRMLEQRVTPGCRALILNFPTNPTGAAMQPDDAAGIAAFAVERDLVVLDDAIYSDLVYGAPRVTIAAAPGMRERTVFLGGFSKAWAMTGFRLGFACGPAALIEAMMKIHQYTMLCAPILSQKAAAEALRSGAGDMEEMRSQYEMRRNLAHASLNRMGLPCALPGGAFYAFPYVGDCGMSSREFALRLLDEENVACVPGSAFGPSGEGFLRCCYAVDMERLKEALGRMERFVSRRRRPAT
jgi:aminotransferase